MVAAPSFKSEELTNYEVGLKTTCNNMFRFNAAVYYEDWNNIQYSVVVSGAQGAGITGNAGVGPGNFFLEAGTHSSAEIIRSVPRGLYVTELIGMGVNGVTGDYSRGASGFWVEKGRIAYPVQEITIAGNLRDMYKGILAVGADAYNYGAKTVGSVLIDRMKIAGS